MADLIPIPMEIPWDQWDPSLPHSHAHLYFLSPHCDNTVLSTVTIIVYRPTHQLYSFHNTAVCCSRLELPQRSLSRVCNKHRANSRILLNPLAGNKYSSMCKWKA